MFDTNFWRAKLLPFTGKSNYIGAYQVSVTLIPFFLLWLGYAYSVQYSRFVVIPFAILATLFVLRTFVMMHDCGHDSLFKSRKANQIFGFIFGVINGMPQYVWSKNHAYHHNTNGDWVRYGGVFNILSTDNFENLTFDKQKKYWMFRQPLILIPAGFFYVLFNPRVNWLFGHLVIAYKFVTGQELKTRFWKSKKDYLHMTYNNIALFAVWFVACQLMAPADFFLLYVISTSLAGSVGILLFTIQHNFEGSYATDTARVNYYRAALEGTSMLVLPRFLNWFTADIAYHHIHHLSIAVPNYRLKACHKELEEFFDGVKRVHARDLLGTFKFQLWDKELEQVVPRGYVRPEVVLSH